MRLGGFARWIGCGLGRRLGAWLLIWRRLKLASFELRSSASRFWPTVAITATQKTTEGEKGFRNPAERSFDVVTEYGREDLVKNQYLPPDPLRARVTYIRAPKGAGKTELAKQLHQNIKGSCIVPTHRRSLARGLSARMGLPNYQDATD